MLLFLITYIYFPISSVSSDNHRMTECVMSNVGDQGITLYLTGVSCCSDSTHTTLQQQSTKGQEHHLLAIVI